MFSRIRFYLTARADRRRLEELQARLERTVTVEEFDALLIVIVEARSGIPGTHPLASEYHDLHHRAYECWLQVREDPMTFRWEGEETFEGSLTPEEAAEAVPDPRGYADRSGWGPEEYDAFILLIRPEDRAVIRRLEDILRAGDTVADVGVELDGIMEAHDCLRATAGFPSGMDTGEAFAAVERSEAARAEG